MDCIYSAVLHSLNKYKLMVLSGYDKSTEKTELCYFKLLSNEDIYTFKEIYKYLYENFKFLPRNIMVDFNLAQINALNKIFNNINIYMGVFFHYSQYIWRNFRKYGLCKKGSYNENSIFIFNL